MKLFTSPIALGLSLCLLAACGDDSATGGNGGEGGAGAAGGAGDGGNPTSTMITSSTNTTGMMEETFVGDPCLADDECGDGFCVTEELQGFPLGYCSIECSDNLDCGGEICLTDQATPVCAKGCETAADCRDAYDCVAAGRDNICLPACTSSDQCTDPQECITDEEDPNVGLCIEPEVCDDTEDNDHDGFPNCADADCGADAGCAAAIGDACAAATVGTSPTNGDTADGTDLFAVACSGFVTGAGLEVLYSIPTPVAGTLHVSADPTATDGSTDMVLYARSDCADAATTAACADDPMDGSATESIDVVALGGETWTIYVDSYIPGTEGPYTFTFDFEVAVCGDGNITAPETCDDGGIIPGDGCSATCAVELDFYCAAATPITVGTTNGDTTTGTSFFDAPVDADECTFGAGVNGREVLYVYTPATSGMLTIELAPTGDTDMGLYARTDCADGASQVGCSDVNFQTGMQDETLTIPVVASEAVTIFVDSFQSNGGPFSVTLTQN